MLSHFRNLLPSFLRRKGQGAELSRVSSRTLHRTGMFLSQHLWVWPIMAIVLLMVLGFTVRVAVESTMMASLRSQLETLRDVEAEMLSNWLDSQHSLVLTQANDPQLRQMIYQILKTRQADSTTAAKAQASISLGELRDQLKQELHPAMSAQRYTMFSVIDDEGKVLISSQPELEGVDDLVPDRSVIRKLFDGKTVVTPPFRSRHSLRNESGERLTNQPTILVCAPVRDANFQVVAALVFRVDPRGEFTRIMQLGRMGRTGETYAFTKEGVMASKSRFDPELMLLGLLPDEKDAESLLYLQLKNPGGDMTRGFRPKVRRSELPLTYAASEAIEGRTLSNVDGVPDYRGVNTVVAVTWLPKHELGICTKIDADEAYGPLIILRWTAWTLYGLFGLSTIAIFVFTIIVARLNRKAREAALDAKQIGQYRLEEKLGSGGMGTVYKGQHALLRRPTAIKMLSFEKTNETSIARFEREVQITCQLNHPNTVAIYDYGRTPEGIFYYAMEYLDGIDLQHLVERYGPQPEGRVVSILKQACGSLQEAHTQGLVHRDIKPANLMLNRRGGIPDLLKVLDFGLVKAIDEDRQASLTAHSALTGTPLYLSPEAIQTPNLVDHRTDIYALGAVGYFLLTGKPVFMGENLVDLCRMHISEPPVPPSEKLGQPIDQTLELLIMSCLEKQPSKRPQSAREMCERLERVVAATEWALIDAETWWARHLRMTGKESTGSSANSTSQYGTSGSSSQYERTIIS